MPDVRVCVPVWLKIGAVFTLKMYVLLAVFVAFTAETFTLNFPYSVGVPLMCPAESMLRPFGNPVAVNVIVGVPVAVTSAL